MTSFEPPAPEPVPGRRLLTPSPSPFQTVTPAGKTQSITAPGPAAFGRWAASDLPSAGARNAGPAPLSRHQVQLFSPVGRGLAWGYNGQGQLGDGTTTESSVPAVVQLPTGTSVTSIGAGYAHSLAVTSTGGVLAWGFNVYGQLGDGSTADTSVPVAVHLSAGTAVTAVAAGQAHSLALTSTGQVFAWGWNPWGQLGDGTTTDSSVPVAVQLPVGTTVIAIAAGAGHSLALTSTGQILAWGLNSNGELGNDSTAGSSVPVEVQLPAGATATAIAAGYLHNLALTSTGQILAWGSNFHGESGNGSTTDPVTVPREVQLPTDTTATAIGVGYVHSLAVTSAGQVLAWGWNSNGQLGDGTTIDSSIPVAAQLPADTTITAVAAGDSHSLALTSTGAILAWGLNSAGELGDGTTTERHMPVVVQLPTGTTVTAISAGEAHSLAVATQAVTLTGITPAQGAVAGGTQVVITGSGLFGATVLIGGRPATDLFYNLAGTALIATTPPGAPGPATVTVETTSGSASITGGFTYLLAPAAPAVSPGQGTVTGGTQVTITGIGLSGATSVTFDGAPATIDSDSDTTITVSTPPGAPGPATVVVTTPGGTSNSLTFTYVPLPVPVGISPSQGPSTGGTRATITGSSLSSATLVTFNGAPATIESSSDTAVTLSTPSGTPGAAAVVVTTAGGTAVVPGGFTYIDPTTLTAAPAVIRRSGPSTVIPSLSATLTDALTGRPVSGQTVTFTVNTATGPLAAGAVVTDADGIATRTDVHVPANAVTAATYTAAFTGTSGYLPSTTTAPLTHTPD